MCFIVAWPTPCSHRQFRRVYSPVCSRAGHCSRCKLSTDARITVESQVASPLIY